MVIDAPPLENVEILGELRLVVDRAFAKAKNARDADLMGECIALIVELDRRIGAARKAELFRQSSKGLLTEDGLTPQPPTSAAGSSLGSLEMSTRHLR